MKEKRWRAIDNPEICTIYNKEMKLREKEWNKMLDNVNKKTFGKGLEYYTPEISDFRVGYEYEFQGLPKGWYKMTFNTKNNLEILEYNLKQKDCIRVPYLTKEQILNEGWEFIGTGYDGNPTQGFLKNESDLKFWFSSTKRIEIRDSNGNTLYYGDCKSINEFRYICKLLGI